MMRLRDLPEDVNALSGIILDSAIEVHRHLGNRLAEKTYRDCLAYELQTRGRVMDVEHPITLRYKDFLRPNAYFADLLVDEKVVVELKAIPKLEGEDESQLLTYLEMTGCPLGLLFNFHAPRIKDDFRRFAHSPSRASA